MSEYDHALELAEAAALEAGRLLRDNLDSRAEALHKGEVDLVTRFDRASQEILVGRIGEAFPHHGILAEEGFSRPARSDFRWIIDPLDGTTNYAHTLPIFAVSVALEHRGRVAAGVVHDPMRRETFRAVAGGGATLNGAPISVSRVGELDQSLLSTGFPYDVRASLCNNLDHWANFLVRAQAVRRCGSAALDLCYVACGRFDGFWELKLKPWDVAAGALIVVEAGGRVSDLAGGTFVHDGWETVASNGLIHEAMIEVLRLGCPPERRV
jgi:myo-inositol-1(or 4)-monophosphatase